MTPHQRAVLFEYRAASACNWVIYWLTAAYCVVVYATDVQWDWWLVLIVAPFFLLSEAYEGKKALELKEIG